MEFPHGKTSRSNLADDRTEDEKRKEYAIEKATEKLTNKIFELELLEVMARETGLKLRTSEKEVAEHKRKLEELQYQKWTKMNDFCDRVWKFSAVNDFTDLLNKYLDMPKRNHRKSVEIVDERHPEVVKLRSDVDKLKIQLAEKKAHSLGLEENLLQAKHQLNIAELYREMDPKIIHLLKEIDKYRDEVSALEIQIQVIEEVKSGEWSRLFLTPLPVTDNDDFVTAAELIAQEENKAAESRIKKPKFSVKRESAISRKLADIGWAIRRD